MWASSLTVAFLLTPLFWTSGEAGYHIDHHNHGQDAPADASSTASSDWVNSTTPVVSELVREKRQGDGLTGPLTHCVGLGNGNAQCIAGTRTWMQMPGVKRGQPTTITISRRVGGDTEWQSCVHRSQASQTNQTSSSLPTLVTHANVTVSVGVSLNNQTDTSTIAKARTSLQTSSARTQGLRLG